MGQKVVWNDIVLVESDETQMVEGNHYFPPESINQEYFKSNSMQTVCPWKGAASYYDVEVNGDVLQGVAWYYPEPSNAARQIKDHVAFYQRGGIRVVEDDA